jgi:serine protease Do
VIKGDKVKVLGADAKTDLAVVRVEAEHLITAKWGDSDQLERGDWVLAFGSPFGYVGSMTHGIVSALNRQAGILSEKQGYENFIQVDAPINPGNSGGPLTNIHGEVVGINTAIASRSGSFSGLGFAIPSNQAKFVYSSLKERGKVTRGWLGVGIVDIQKDPGLAKSFNYTGDKGVLVQETFSNTPATGKLQNGDIITEVNGKPAEDVQHLRNTVAATKPGDDVKLKVWREGKYADVDVKIGEQPEDLTAIGMRNGGRGAPNAGGNNPGPASKSEDKLGLRLTTPSDQLLQQFGLGEEAKQGAVITSVKANSPAYKAGLRPGVVITRVNNQPVKDAAEASAAIAKQDLSKGIRFYVVSPDGSRFVFVEP